VSERDFAGKGEFAAKENGDNIARGAWNFAAAELAGRMTCSTA
jgi:hypothetical protein